MKRFAFAVMALWVAHDAAGGVGTGSSVAIGADGLALISYSDRTNSTLKVAHCANLACTSATFSSFADGRVQTALATGADGLGLIIASSPRYLFAAHCSNLECSSATLSILYEVSPSGGGVGSRSVVMGPDGLALILYGASDVRIGTSIEVKHCSNPACSAHTTETVDSSPIGFSSIDGGMALGSDGLPLLTYTKYYTLPIGRYQLVVAHCADALCSADSATLIGNGDRPFSVAMGGDGLGLVVYTTSGVGLQVAHCADTACTSASTAVLDATGPIADATVARGADGLGLITYVSGDDLKVAHCSDAACSAATVTVLDSVARVVDNGLAIGADGLGLISYGDRDGGDLKVAHCENVACTSATVTVVDDGLLAADLYLAMEHSPEPVMRLQTLNYTLRPENFGPDSAAQVVVRQTLAEGLVFQAASGGGWSCTEASRVVTCTTATSASGLQNIHVQATAPPTPQVLPGTATISSATLDLVPENNTATDLATVTGPLAEVAVAMSDGGAVVHPGQPFTWTITASNQGATPVLGAAVTDVFPATVSNVTWTCFPFGGASCPASGTGDIAASVNLPGGNWAVFTATGTLSPSTYVLSNTATIAPPFGSYDPNPADNTVTLASQPEPTQAYTLAPCRVLDTRVSPPPLAANTTRTLTVTGTCAVPADARAVMVNATAVAPGDRGNLRLYPTGATAPLASSLNFAPGRTRANNAVVPLGTDGQISVQCDMPPGSTATTHFVLDVFGYFK